MQIGSFAPKNPFFLAPMAGITDGPFRVLCAEQGAGLVYTEMLNARALFHDDVETLRMAKTFPVERPVAVQIFGHEPEMIAHAVRVFSQRSDIALIDINMGCPAPKIVKNGDGCILMQNLPLAKTLMKAAVNAARASSEETGNAPKPITVKTRKGWNGQSINYLDLAKTAEEAGISAITLHARTREEMYTGTADWESIKILKDNLSIPVIGNGDVQSLADGTRRMQESGCDAVMIGRAAQGNPWVFSEHSFRSVVNLRRLSEENAQILLQTILRHANLLAAEKGEHTAMLEMRKHIAWYLHGLHGAAQVRAEVYTAMDHERVNRILSDYLTNYLNNLPST